MSCGISTSYIYKIVCAAKAKPECESLRDISLKDFFSRFAVGNGVASERSPSVDDTTPASSDIPMWPSRGTNLHSLREVGNERLSAAHWRLRVRLPRSLRSWLW